MTTTADMGSSTFRTAPGADHGTARSAAASAGGKAARPAISDRTVVIYILLAVIALLPGLIAAANIGYDSQSLIGGLLHQLQQALKGIKFGSGLRFWLGISGAGMIALLLLYPLRKAFAGERRLGKVSGWFHIHILFGLFGPVLILYHANFSHGAFNANVALWSMLIVAVGGLAGYFVYMRVSAGFYGDKLQAAKHREALFATLRILDAPYAARFGLIERIEAFEARLLGARRGIIASLVARIAIARARPQFKRDLNWLISAHAEAHGFTSDQQYHMARGAHEHLAYYLARVRSAAGRSALERLWAHWRLFHMPVFVVMLVAAGLHISAVWEWDDAGTPASYDGFDTAAAFGDETETAPDTAPAKRPAGVIRQLSRRTVVISPDTGASEARTLAAGSAAASGNDLAALIEATREPDSGQRVAAGAAAEVKPKLLVAPQRVARRSAARRRVAAVVAPAASPELPPLRPEPAPERRAAAAPAPLANAPAPFATRPVVSRPIASTPVVNQPVAEPARIKAPRKIAVRPAAPKPIAAVIEPVEAPAPPPPRAAPPADPQPAGNKIATVYDELQRRTQEDAMGLGAPKPRNLADQIAALKAKQFKHSEAETGFGFAMVGKHKRNDCTDCHKKPLRDKRQPNPRTCINCHKEDDVHKGRKPDCAQCHTPVNWSKIIKKR